MWLHRWCERVVGQVAEADSTATAVAVTLLTSTGAVSGGRAIGRVTASGAQLATAPATTVQQQQAITDCVRMLYLVVRYDRATSWRRSCTTSWATPPSSTCLSSWSTGTEMRALSCTADQTAATLPKFASKTACTSLALPSPPLRRAVAKALSAAIAKYREQHQAHADSLLGASGGGNPAMPSYGPSVTINSTSQKLLAKLQRKDAKKASDARALDCCSCLGKRPTAVCSRREAVVSAPAVLTWCAHVGPQGAKKTDAEVEVEYLLQVTDLIAVNCMHLSCLLSCCAPARGLSWSWPRLPHWPQQQAACSKDTRMMKDTHDTHDTDTDTHDERYTHAAQPHAPHARCRQAGYPALMAIEAPPASVGNTIMLAGGVELRIGTGEGPAADLLSTLLVIAMLWVGIPSGAAFLGRVLPLRSCFFLPFTGEGRGAVKGALPKGTVRR